MPLLTHRRQNVKDDKHQVGNVGQLEDCLPAQLENAKIVVDESDKARNQVQGNQGSISDQRLLSDKGPRGVADSHEDGLKLSVRNARGSERVCT